MGPNINSKRNTIIDFIKKNPNATHRLIIKATSLHPERYFNGLAEAYEIAGIKPPRTFERKTKEQKRKIVVDYIRKYPNAGSQTIAKETKINILSVFKTIRGAFNAAGMPYLKTRRIRSKEKRRLIISEFIKVNPLANTNEITKKLKISPYKVFNSTKEMYELAGINPVTSHEKRKINIQNKIINYIKKNSLATQRQINKCCKTSVQKIFKNGIFEAYEKAGINYPFERLKLYGTALKEIKKRARDFEEEIAVKLSGFGNVNHLVKTKRGVADIILEHNGKNIIIEVKDYLNKEICFSEVKQLNKYLVDCNSNIGILICHKKPMKDRFKIGKNRLFILEKEEISKIPFLI